MRSINRHTVCLSATWDCAMRATRGSMWSSAWPVPCCRRRSAA